MPDAAPTVAERLQRLEDLDEIRQLFIAYGHHLDAGDVQAYSELFATDGELLLGPMGHATGPEAIRELMAKVLGRVTGRSYHLVTNPVIHLDGDRATSEVLWTVIRPDAGGRLEVAMFGRHRDELVREAGRWRFRRRRGVVDVPAGRPG
jgi:uncharacterized protein (TIGR02246 family)